MAACWRSERRPNAILRTGPIRITTRRHLELDAGDLPRFRARPQVSAIVPVTHGATAALVDGDGLVLPVLDYEAALASVSITMPSRPPYSETLLAGAARGPEPGRQLAWLRSAFPLNSPARAIS
jgi:L-fuculokinase